MHINLNTPRFPLVSLAWFNIHVHVFRCVNNIIYGHLHKAKILDTSLIVFYIAFVYMYSTCTSTIIMYPRNDHLKQTITHGMINMKHMQMTQWLATIATWIMIDWKERNCESTWNIYYLHQYFPKQTGNSCKQMIKSVILMHCNIPFEECCWLRNHSNCISMKIVFLSSGARHSKMI